MVFAGEEKIIALVDRLNRAVAESRIADVYLMLERH